MEEDSEIGRRDDDADGKRSAEKEDEGCSEPSGERGERERASVDLGLDSYPFSLRAAERLPTDGLLGTLFRSAR